MVDHAINDMVAAHVNSESLNLDFERIPGRVFLDTCVVNLWLNYGRQIHDGEATPSEIPIRLATDINALRQLLLVCQTAEWQLAVSPLTFVEVSATKEHQRADELTSWFGDVWSYWRTFLLADNQLPTFAAAEQIRLDILTSRGMDRISDQNDRILLCDAAAYGCDAFCTRDWSTILRHREYLLDYPMPIITPTEWWKLVEPYAAIWA